ncbi:MAG: A/G-specific adenine glycosylase [Planctomycetota bacterium]
MPITESLSPQLLAWFDRHARDLPWRRSSDPWAILISEVMLQQTRAEVVTGYFPRFLKRFPTPDALAKSTDEELLSAWAGLGYYRRARNLREAARQIVEQHDGRVPAGFRAILSLPGVGRYTAGAVSSIAFGERQPVVDGNVARVLSRLFLVAGDFRSGGVARQLWELAGQLLDPKRPGDHNQALMELGALICLPRSPRCLQCPLTRRCQARKSARIEQYPTPRQARPTVPVRMAAVAIRKGRQIALVKRAKGGLMEGMFDLPAIEIGPEEDARAPLELWLKDRFGITIRGLEPIGVIRHTVTHRRITANLFAAVLAGTESASLIRETAEDPAAGHGVAPAADEQGIRFFRVEQVAGLGLSALGRKLLALAGIAPPKS